ncbi:MAG: hypothetical protein ACQKBV_08010 [Puniceicoccales bacterium]
MSDALSINLDDSTPERIGFPPPLLGDVPLRLPVAPVADGLLALGLPGGLLSEAHPFYAGQPPVIAAIQAQLRASKPELERLGLEIALGINFIEPEMSGVLLVGVTRPGVERWRNALGSRQLRFRYDLVARADANLPGILECDLPLARHRREDRMLVSHKTGKKCTTTFTRVGQLGELDLWRAETLLPRLHQIRVHAMEVGLALPGESLYGEHATLTWADFGRKGASGARTIATAPMIHLAEISPVTPEIGLPPVIAKPTVELAQAWDAFEQI